jgi:hypothetical protein
MPNGLVMGAGKTTQQLLDEQERMRMMQQAMAEGPSAELMAAEDADVIASGNISGRQTWRNQDTWNAGNAISAPVVGILNKVLGKDKKLQPRQDAAIKSGQNRLTQSREKAAMGRRNDASKIANEQMFKVQDQRRGLSATRKNLEDGNQWKKDAVISERDWDKGNFELKPFHDPKDPTRTLNLYTNGRDYFHTDKTPVAPELLAQLTEFTAPSTGSRGNAQRQKRDDSMEATEASIRPYINNMKAFFASTKDDLNNSLGTLDPKRWQTQLGLFSEDNPEFARLSQIQQMGKYLSYANMAPMLEVLTGSKSDKDVELAMSTGTSLSDNPSVWVGNFKRSVIPMLMSKARRAQSATGRTNEEINGIEQELMSIAEAAERRHSIGYGPKGGGVSATDADWAADYERRMGMNQ